MTLARCLLACCWPALALRCCLDAKPACRLPSPSPAPIALLCIQELRIQEDELVAVQWMVRCTPWPSVLRVRAPLVPLPHPAPLSYSSTAAAGRVRRHPLHVLPATLPPAPHRAAGLRGRQLQARGRTGGHAPGSSRGWLAAGRDPPPPTLAAADPHSCLAACRGLAGRKLEAGFNARHDLLLFGEAADAAGGVEGHADEDVWLGLETAAADDAAGAAPGGGGTTQG